MVPVHRRPVVHRANETVIVHQPNVALSSRVSLIRRLEVTIERCWWVGCHAKSQAVEIAETVLTGSVAFVGSFPEPVMSGRVVLMNTISSPVHISKLDLGGCVTECCFDDY